MLNAWKVNAESKWIKEIRERRCTGLVTSLLSLWLQLAVQYLDMVPLVVSKVGRPVLVTTVIPYTFPRFSVIPYRQGDKLSGRQWSIPTIPITYFKPPLKRFPVLFKLFKRWWAVKWSIPTLVPGCQTQSSIMSLPLSSGHLIMKATWSKTPINHQNPGINNSQGISNRTII